MTSFATSLSDFYKRWFHKRNIIIVSERKVKHVPISGGLQFIGLSLTLTCVCLASYSTGSYIAARSALKEQGQALRSVTNAHIESNFNTIYQPAVAENNTPIAPASPTTALSSMDNATLLARITLLQSKVDELKHTNEAIVQSVHDKTASHLDTLKDVIRQTGLNLSELKKEYKEEDASEAKHENKAPAQGGPYIPDENPMAPDVKAMLSGLDDLALMSRIVGNLPLAVPIENAEQQSTFGHRIDPFNGHLAFHSGLDLSGPIGSKIYSTADGKVIAAGRNGGYGNAIDIDHGFGITTRYGHLSEILVQEGQLVKKGDVIGIQGSTGRSTGPHLHYEVRYHDQAMNPKNFLEAGQYVSEE